MTRILLFVSLIAISNSLVGQNLTFDQVISFYKKKLPQAEETLSAKNWELITAEEPGGFVMGTSVFAFEKSEFNNSATSFITFRFGNDNIIETILLQVNSTAKYNSYMNRIKALGYKFAKSKVEDGSIQKIYRGKTLTVLIKSKTVIKGDQTSTIYSFFIYRTLGNAFPNTFS